MLVRLAKLHTPTETFTDSETSTNIAGTLLKLAKCEHGKEILIASGALQALRQLSAPPGYIVGEEVSKTCLSIAYRILAIPRALFALGYVSIALAEVFFPAVHLIAAYAYLDRVLGICAEALLKSSKYRLWTRIVWAVIFLALVLRPWPRRAAEFLNPVLPIAVGCTFLSCCSFVLYSAVAVILDRIDPIVGPLAPMLINLGAQIDRVQTGTANAADYARVASAAAAAGAAGLATSLFPGMALGAAAGGLGGFLLSRQGQGKRGGAAEEDDEIPSSMVPVPSLFEGDRPSGPLQPQAPSGMSMQDPRLRRRLSSN